MGSPDSQPTGRRLGKGLNALVRLYRLNVWGDQFESVAKELQMAALLLTVVLIFDLVAWTLVFTFIFTSGDSIVSRWTPLAILPGCLFATGFFIYERQFITHDTTGIGKSPGHFFRFMSGVSLRVLIILGGATITALPFELIVFRHDIAERVHQESVRAEALRHLTELDRREKVKVTDQPTAILAQLISQTAQAERDVRAAQVVCEGSKAQQAAAERPPADTAEDQALIRRLRNETPLACGKLVGAENHWAELQETVAKERAKVREEAANRPEAITDLSDFIHKIIASFPGETIKPVRMLAATDTSYQFRDRQYNAFKRLAVLRDFDAGVPPHWLDQGDAAPAALKARLVTEFHLDSGELTDSQTQVYGYGTVAFFILGMLIPLITIPYKLLLPNVLRMYFSPDWQAKAHQPEAVQYKQAVDARDRVDVRYIR